MSSAYSQPLLSADSSLSSTRLLPPLKEPEQDMQLSSHAGLFLQASVSVENIGFKRKWDFPLNILLGWQVCDWNQDMKKHAPVVFSISGFWLFRDTWCTEGPVLPTPLYPHSSGRSRQADLELFSLSELVLSGQELGYPIFARTYCRIPLHTSSCTSLLSASLLSGVKPPDVHTHTQVHMHINPHSK